MSGETILRVHLEAESDVFAARRVGRDCSAALGLDRLDAVRVATALSEVSREVVLAGGGDLTFSFVPPDTISVVLVVSGAAVASGSLPRSASWEAGLEAANRLMDQVDVALGPDGRPTVTLSKRLGSRVEMTADRRAELNRRLQHHAARTPGEELREQNRELIAALEEVRRQKADLEVANAELEETNRGVMALYDELSTELERTNKGVVALYAEIDDKNRQLREASEAKSRFLRSISHELRTPGNSILGLTRLLLDDGGGYPLDTEQQEQIGYIRTSAEDLLRLVNELLDLAKAESGHLDATLRDVSLQQLFEELRGTIEPLLRPAVALVADDPGAAGRLRSDPELIRHVLRNLLSNAAKFTEAGEIGLSAHRDGDRVLVEVRDTGLGMSPEDQVHVFEEFYQVRTPLHATVRGTGLGLPFAQRVARALGGELTLRSEQDVGSVFTLSLPVAGPAPDAGAAVEAGEG
ncbi:ATP-binding protein [Nocardioides koreensis]|uniref:histidine kinase n=1 Tax=Nocardioides koreensis TaxID=433651 RepID=A0ABP5LBS3_9ACTN